MKVVINAVSAKIGGAATYLRSVLGELARQLDAPARANICVWRGTTSGEWPKGVEYRDPASEMLGSNHRGSFSRLWFDQIEIVRELRAQKADVLFSSANFASFHVPCRQVLLVRNAAYFDPVYMSRVSAVGPHAFHLAQRFLTILSMATATDVLFPTQAMLDLVGQTLGRVGHNWRVSHYGTKLDQFTPCERSTFGQGRPLRLLNVGLYADQKNLGTLFRALHSIDERAPRSHHLTVTAGFTQDGLVTDPFAPHYVEERGLFGALRDRGIAEDTDWKQHGSLPELYRSADVFVFPSYTESFGHPLLEAMASGLPVIASDVPVNREICADAALYFPVFDAEACAASIRRLADDAALFSDLRRRGLERVQHFTWERHVRDLVRAFRGDDG